MTLRRGLLLTCAATTLFAQEFPHIDTDAIHRAAEKARLAAEDVKIHMDLKEVEMAVEAAVNVQTDLLANKEIFASIGPAIARSREAMNMAFNMQAPFSYNRSGAGRTPMTPDEEMKAMAIDSIMQTDADRAVPIVEKVLLNQQASIRLRLRALQALGRSNSTKARELVVRTARDSSNPELQSRAIQLLGERENTQDKQLLNEIYAASTNADIKHQVLRSLGSADDWQRLLAIAKTEKDEELRNRAIKTAGGMKSAGVADALVAMYGSTTDASIRNTILKSLSQERNAKQLIALARKETNPDLKRAALQQLTRMKGEEVTTYLTELLEK